MAYSLARSYFNPGVPGSIPGWAGPRKKKLMLVYLCEFRCYWMLIGSPLLAYSLARSSFNPRVLGLIPSSAGLRKKLIDAGILV